MSQRRRVSAAPIHQQDSGRAAERRAQGDRTVGAARPALRRRGQVAIGGAQLSIGLGACHHVDHHRPLVTCNHDGAGDVSAVTIESIDRLSSIWDRVALAVVVRSHHSTRQQGNHGIGRRALSRPASIAIDSFSTEVQVALRLFEPIKRDFCVVDRGQQRRCRGRASQLDPVPRGLGRRASRVCGGRARGG